MSKAIPSVVIGDTVTVEDATTALEMADAVVMDDAANVHYTKDGYLSANPRIARTGVQLYRGSECGRPDLERVRVYRSEDSVFAKDAMHSLAHRPVTIEHPPERVTADNWKKYAVGHTGDEVVRDGGAIRVPMTLMDHAAIKEFKDGRKQLSVGYTCNLKWKAGVTADGEQYDALQSDIRANHLAVVAAARGGSTLVIGDEHNGDSAMELKNVMVDGISCQMTDTAAQIVQRTVQSLNDQLDDFKKKFKKQEEDDDETEDSIKAKDAEIVTLKQQLKDAQLTPAMLDALVKDRSEVVEKASKVMGKTIKADGLTVDDIRREVVNAKLGDSAKGWDDKQVRASFDTLQAPTTTTKSTLDSARAAFSQPGSAATSNDAQAIRDAAYADSVDDLETAWMPKDQRAASMAARKAMRSTS